MLLRTDNQNVGRIRTYSSTTSNIEDMLDLTGDSALNTMLQNEEILVTDSWPDIVCTDITDSSISNNNVLSFKEMAPPSIVRSKSVVSVMLTPGQEPAISYNRSTSSPSLNLLNCNLTAPTVNGGVEETSRIDEDTLEEPDFNVLHLDDDSIPDLGSLPLFNIDDDMSSLLQQFEEVSQQSVEDTTPSGGVVTMVSSEPSLVELVPAPKRPLHRSVLHIFYI